MRRYSIVFYIMGQMIVAALFDSKNRLVDTESVHLECCDDPVFSRVLDPLHLIYSVRSVLTHLLSRLSGNRFQIMGLSFMTHFPGWLAWDKESGLPVLPLVSIDDSVLDAYEQKLRLNPYYLDLLKQVPEPDMAMRYWSLGFCFSDQLQSKTFVKNRLVVSSVDSWLLYHLTGRKVCGGSYDHVSEAGFVCKGARVIFPEEYPLERYMIGSVFDAQQDEFQSYQFVPLQDGVSLRLFWTWNGLLMALAKDQNTVTAVLDLSLNQRLMVAFSGSYTYQDSVFWSVMSSRVCGSACRLVPPGLPKWMRYLNSEPLLRVEDMEPSIYFLPCGDSSGHESGMVSGLTNQLTTDHLWMAYWRSLGFMVRQKIEYLESRTPINVTLIMCWVETKDWGTLEMRLGLQLMADSLQIGILAISLEGVLFEMNRQLGESLNLKSFKRMGNDFESFRLMVVPNVDPISSLAYYNDWTSMCETVNKEDVCT